MANDPLRVLGLGPDASAAEIKQAYRALAKANHPDSAGESALPKFLAVQAAYEQLVISRGRTPGRSRSRSTVPEPWRAEPARAQESRAGMRGPGAERAGARRTRPKPDQGSSTSGRAGGSPSGGTRQRATRKATFGSTTYDEAHDPADPSWYGAAWYGPSSGEYWTVNPREYADPRKHGPEYQARAAERIARTREFAESAEASGNQATGTHERGDNAQARTADRDAATHATGTAPQSRRPPWPLSWLRRKLGG